MAAHFIKATLTLGPSKTRRGKHIRVLEAVREILKTDARFRDDIPPESEMPNSESRKIVRAACQRLNKKPAPPH
jgi:hypothetical protein